MSGIISHLSYLLHSEVIGSQSCIVDLQDELGICDVGRNDLAKQGKTHKMMSLNTSVLQIYLWQENFR